MVRKVAIFCYATVCLLLLPACNSSQNENSTLQSNPKHLSTASEQVVLEKPETYFIASKVEEERLAPSLNGSVTNRIYRGQAVVVYEVRPGWARISQGYPVDSEMADKVAFASGTVEVTDGKVARWVRSTSLSKVKPDLEQKIVLPADARIKELPNVGDHGLRERDVLILHAAARYFLDTNKLSRVDWGDKSVTKPGMYYLMEDAKNHFFFPNDIPDLESRIGSLLRNK
ncbi:MAG: hypothetical protein U0640_09580 [Phycisphaerales bacterium]